MGTGGHSALLSGTCEFGLGGNPGPMHYHPPFAVAIVAKAFGLLDRIVPLSRGSDRIFCRYRYRLADFSTNLRLSLLRGRGRRMCCLREIPSPPRGISGKSRRATSSPIVVAIVSMLLIANPRAVGLTIADLDPSQHYKLEQIDLSGERAFSRDAVVSVMTTKERPWYQVWKPPPDFDPQMFKDDLAHIERFYQAHGYYNTHVTYDLTLDKDEVTTHIKVGEGKPVRAATINIKVANSSPPPQELDRSFKLPLKKGDIFDQDVYQTGAQDLINLYTTHSYANTKVQRHAVVEVASLQAHVQYEVESGGRCVFGNTKITGVEKVDP